MKTAISLPDQLFAAIEKVAQARHLSRSEIYSQALQDFLEKEQNQKILETLNKVYSEETEEEQILRKKVKTYISKKFRVKK